MRKNWDLKRLIFNISSLVHLGQEVTSSKGFNEKIKGALYVVTGIFSIPRAALLIYNTRLHSLDLLTSKGLKGIDGTILRIEHRHIKVLKKNEIYSIKELQNNPFYKQNETAFKTLQTRTFIPLFVKEEFLGALSLGRRLSRTSYLQSEADTLRAIANQISTTLHNSNLFKRLAHKATENKKLYENMRHIYHNTVQAFAAAIDAKDVYTKNHSNRVAKISVAIARELSWKDKDVEGIYIAGLLHDIGKIVLDRVVIRSKNLTNAEMDEIRKHPKISYDIISKIKFPWKDISDFVRHHHERIDGKGYPDSLRDKELSDGAKIIALADAFDAMTTERPYQKKRTLNEALIEIKECLGTQFDGNISKAFFKTIQKEIKGELKDPQVLPYLDKDFDPSIIIMLLEGIIAELSS